MPALVSDLQYTIDSPSRSQFCNSSELVEEGVARKADDGYFGDEPIT